MLSWDNIFYKLPTYTLVVFDLTTHIYAKEILRPT
jgi:hypothetical protein